MVKFLKITAAIVLLLLVFFAGMSKYRTYQAEQTEIPKSATSLIQINVDELYKTIAVNVLSHPMYYFKSDFKKDTAAAEPDKRFTGISIPASIYLYNLANKPADAIFSRLEIESIGGFESFIKNVLHLQITKKTEGINMAKSSPGNLVIYYNRKAAAFAIASRVENLESDLLNILNKKNTVKVNASKFAGQLSIKKHVVFSNKDHNGWIDFNDGRINFNDIVSAANILPTNKPFQHRQSPGNTINFWLSANLKPDSNKVFKFKNFSLEQDSLSRYYNGNLDFMWTNSITQTDSIITYEYNDDFEKVEKVSLQKRSIPSISLNLNSNGYALKRYLTKQGLINPDSNMISKNAFPLYNIYINSEAENLNLSTFKNSGIKPAKTFSNDAFYLSIDFIKLNKQIEIPLISHYFNIAKYLEIKGKWIENKKIKVEGKFELKNQEINALYQLLKSFN